MALTDLDARKIADNFPAHKRQHILDLDRVIEPLLQNPHLVASWRELLGKFKELNLGSEYQQIEQDVAPLVDQVHLAEGWRKLVSIFKELGSSTTISAVASAPVIANEATPPVDPGGIGTAGDPAAQRTAPANARTSVPPSR